MTRTDRILALMSDGEIRTAPQIAETLNLDLKVTTGLLRPLRHRGDLSVIPDTRPMQLVNKSPEEMASLCLTRDIERSIRILERYGYTIVPPKQQRASA